MEQLIGLPTSWKAAETLQSCKQLIDYGVILSWKDMRRLRKALTDDEQKEVLRHFAVRLAERVENRLPEEILIESLLVWLANACEENQLAVFLEELFQQPNCAEACLTLVELALTSEVSDLEHSEDIFAMAVALICELGLAVRSIEGSYPGDFRDAERILNHIATYLLSVSNSSNGCIRLSLLHYFGATESHDPNKNGFNRIMGRFGHTVLEQLFNLLFNKKTEAVALQYLLENTPYILQADNHSQKILHETFKFYMLKKPERFALFIQTLAAHLQSLPKETFAQAGRVYLQHLGVLLKVASEVNHKDLGREIMCSIVAFENEPYRDELVQTILRDATVRDSFRELLAKLRQAPDSNQVIESTSSFRSSKRGRKPSFARAGEMETIHQITILGQQQVARAS